MKKKPGIIITVIWAGVGIFTLIGILVIEAVETIRSGYEIADLRRDWQKEHCRFTGFKKKYISVTSREDVETFVKRRFALRYPEPFEIIFIETKDHAGK